MRKQSATLAGLVLAGLMSLAAVPSPAMAEAPAPPTRYCVPGQADDGRPRDTCIGLATYTADVCRAIERDADAAGLPAGYFARLIWQESHFDANAMSFAGAQGIAQFMPDTGRMRGLKNPYDPAEALARSSDYLRFLREKFGNLGLAAAAYNGGEGAVGRFITSGGYLAVETLDYVQTITGLPVTQWLAGVAHEPDFSLDPKKPFQQGCLDLAAGAGIGRFTPPTAIVKPWGIQMAQFFSEAISRKAFARIQGKFSGVLAGETLMLVAKRNPNFGPALRYTAEIGRDNRADAQKLCDALEKAGGECIVVRN